MVWKAGLESDPTTTKTEKMADDWNSLNAENSTELRATEPSEDNQKINLLGYTAPDDGGGDFYGLLDGSPYTDDDKDIFKTSGGAVWIRKNSDVIIDNDLTSKNISDSLLASEINPLVTSSNIFDPNNVGNQTGFLLNNDESLTAFADFTVSYYITVEENTQYRFNQDFEVNNQYGIHFYDSAQAPISIDSALLRNEDYATTTPVGAQFMRLSIPNSVINDVEIKKVVYDIQESSGRPFREKNGIYIGDSITAFETWPRSCHNYLLAGNYKNISTAGGRMQTALNNVSQSDITSSDFMILAYGINDYGQNTILGSISDASSDATFYGYTQLVVETVLGWNPNLKLMINTPMWIEANQNPNTEGLFVVDYANAIIEVCEKYCLPVCDLYRRSGVNLLTYSTLLEDGTHPTTTFAIDFGVTTGKALENSGLT